MRKMMTKEVTKTTVKIAKMVADAKGMPKAEQLPDEVLIGNVSLEKAQKEINKKYAGQAVTVFGVEPATEVYQMAVEDFIKHATLKGDNEVAQDQAEENEQEQAS